MIRTFKDKETEKVYNQIFSRKLPNSIQKTALRKLIMIDNAETLEDLKVPPANRLEALKGEQFRICFVFKEGDFYDVEITDYH